MAVKVTLPKVYKGGYGSGHHGHAGRPGHRGGSLPKNNRGGTAPNKIFENIIDLYPIKDAKHDDVASIYRYDLVNLVNGSLPISTSDSSALYALRSGKFDDERTYDILNDSLKYSKFEDFQIQRDRPEDSPFTGFPKGFSEDYYGDRGAQIEARFMFGEKIFVEYYDEDNYDENLRNKYAVFLVDAENRSQKIVCDAREEALRTTYAYINAWYPEGSSTETEISWESASTDDRKMIKDYITRDLSNRTGIEYDRVNALIRQWAISSNGSDMRSLSLQEAAFEEFGTPLDDWQKRDLDELKEYRRLYDDAAEYVKTFRQNVSDAIQMNDYTRANDLLELRDKLWEQNHPGTSLRSIIEREDNIKTIADRDTERKFIRAQYEATQEQFARHGFKPDDTIRLFRGVGKGSGFIPVTEVGNVVKYEGNAVESWSASSRIAMSFGDYVLAMDIPVKNILSTARTGWGCLEEGEFTVMFNQNSEALVMYSRLTEEQHSQ